MTNKNTPDKKEIENQDVGSVPAQKKIGQCNKCGYVGDGQMLVSAGGQVLAAVCVVCFANLLNSSCGVLRLLAPSKPAPEKANREVRRKK